MNDITASVAIIVMGMAIVSLIIAVLLLALGTRHLGRSAYQEAANAAIKTYQIGINRGIDWRMAQDANTVPSSDMGYTPPAQDEPFVSGDDPQAEQPIVIGRN